VRSVTVLENCKLILLVGILLKECLSFLKHRVSAPRLIAFFVCDERGARRIMVSLRENARVWALAGRTKQNIALATGRNLAGLTVKSESHV
jgi:hypothetical protein